MILNINLKKVLFRIRRIDATLRNQKNTRVDAVVESVFLVNSAFAKDYRGAEGDDEA